MKHAWASSSSSSKQKAFTIVELLIVIVVIAILAAITIVAYTGIQDRAKQATLQSAASQASKKILAYAALNTDLYPPDEATFLSYANLQDTPDLDYTYLTSPDRTHYCISATNPTNPTLSTAISDTSPGTVEGRCVRNYALDPAATSMTSGSASGFGWRNSRWFGSAPAVGAYSPVSGASDGPLGGATYIRKTWNTAPASIGTSGDTGFDLGPSGAAAYPVTTGDSWTISCYLRPSVRRNVYIGVYQYTAAGAVHSTVRIYGAEVSAPGGLWTRVSHSYVVASGVGRIHSVCDSASSSGNGAANWAVGSTLDGADLMMTQGAALYAYGDGGSPGWVWEGTPNNSTSFGPAKLQ